MSTIDSSSGDDESLRRQVVEYRSKITSASEAEYRELTKAWLPTDEDLELIYGENSKYAIRMRDIKIERSERTPEEWKNLIVRNRKYGPMNPDEFDVAVKPAQHFDFKVARTIKEGLLKGEFPIRKYTVQTQDSLSGSGPKIHVNGRWVDFIALDKLFIQIGR